ncbi:MAG: anthrone oxygenase family protein [Thermoanaerobaculia bacterium]
MGIFQLALIVATFLCSLVAGFVFAFAVVVMPGIGNLGDGQFLRAFQVMDRVIQNNQPLFMLVWMGSVIALLAAAALGFGQLDGTGRLLIIAAALVYLLGVQLPTVTINVPMNNTVQALEIDRMDETAQEAARQDFESRWNYWNSVRTVLASLVSVLLIILLLRL